MTHSHNYLLPCSLLPAPPPQSAMDDGKDHCWLCLCSLKQPTPLGRQRGM